MPKTVFITSFSGLSARNILSTSVLEILAGQPDLRIVILAPVEKKEDLQRHFGAGKNNIIVEGLSLINVRLNTAAGVQLETTSRSFLEKLFFSLFLHSSDTNSWRVMRLSERKSKGRYIQTFVQWILAKLGNIKLFRAGLRFLDYLLMPKNRYRQYFDKYNPDLVFATDIFNDTDVEIMRAARFRGMHTVGMVRSWDNITSHGLSRVIPDKLIVHTPKIKEEAIKYNDVDSQNIVITGIPHYDRYLSGLRTPRDEFFGSQRR